MEFYPFERCDSENSHIFIKIKIVIIIMIFFACFPAAFAAVLVCGVQYLNAASWALHIILSIWSTLNSQNQEKVVLFPNYSLF